MRRTALSGAEHALWDVFARQLGVPVRALLGGALRTRIPLYANINRAIVDRSPEGFADAARRAVSDGFRSVKIAPFDGLSWDQGAPVEREQLLARGIERTAAVREAIGAGVGLMVDCHGRFNRALALQVSRRLEPFQLAWLEDLLWRADDPRGLAAIAPQIAQTLAGGEEELERRGIGELLSSGSVSTLLPDVKHVGGLAEARRIADLADAARVWVAPHNPAGPIATRVSAELAATLPNLSHLELAWGEASFRSVLVEPPERVVDGFLELTDGPGFGVTRERLDPCHLGVVVPIEPHSFLHRSEERHALRSELLVEAPSYRLNRPRTQSSGRRGRCLRPNCGISSRGRRRLVDWRTDLEPRSLARHRNRPLRRSAARGCCSLSNVTPSSVRAQPTTAPMRRAQLA